MRLRGRTHFYSPPTKPVKRAQRYEKKKMYVQRIIPSCLNLFDHVRFIEY